MKSLKVVLIVSALLSSFNVTAEELKPVADVKATKAERIETELNVIFTRALTIAAKKLDTERKVAPFAVILKKDSTVGFFEADLSSEKSKGFTVSEQVFQLRRYLTEMAIKDGIKASVLGQYNIIRDEKNTTVQGLNFEIEHVDGVALLKFIPVSEQDNDNGEEAKKIIIHTEFISTTVKHANVFTEMTKSISESKR